MTQYTCPCCGAPSEIPLMFTKKRQHIFNYIWNNPGCTLVEIAGACGIDRPSTCGVHISSIVRRLYDTPFRLKILGKGHYEPRRYKIVNQKGPVNASPDVTTVIR